MRERDGRFERGWAMSIIRIAKASSPTTLLSTVPTRSSALPNMRSIFCRSVRLCLDLLEGNKLCAACLRGRQERRLRRLLRRLRRRCREHVLSHPCGRVSLDSADSYDDVKRRQCVYVPFPSCSANTLTKFERSPVVALDAEALYNREGQETVPYLDGI